ncbi:MAG: type I-E CRISPR-associated endoribonuclease Cas2e [Cellulomonas sp.]|nr:type I-E CRISPR-associated endoribonuclease Cas2e [Cellulomonas sp.]
MIVIVLTAVPAGLRGVLTRWLLEIGPGVFVGHVSTRVRDHIWDRVVDGVGRGRAIMVFSKRSEQRLDFRVHGHEWTPVDHDGVSLMLRPSSDRPRRDAPRGWSRAERAIRGAPRRK